MSLEFGEGHFYRVQVWAVGRQEQEPCPTLFEDGFGLLAFVARQVIEDNHVTALQCRGQLGFNIGFKDFAVHWAVNDPRRGQAVMAQRGDEGLRSPVTERGLHLQPLPPASPPPQPRHLGSSPGFVDKDEPFRALLHPGLAVRLPHAPGTNNVSAIGFARQQRFF